jgi:2-polyprenyl-6-methoxyphenol hydroxylase-like FAD-dependent oxidoreductase
MAPKPEIAIIGGGIGGLVTALHMHRNDIRCRVYEAASEFKALGVGITLLPHAIRELANLGLEEKIASVAVRMKESCFFNSFGQMLYRDVANPNNPQYLIHRGDLHAILVDAVNERMGEETITFAHKCVSVAQDEMKTIVKFVDPRTSKPLKELSAEILIGCDGVNSVVRKTLYPTGDNLAYTGINMWRGVTVHPPVLSGGSHIRVGTLTSGKAVIYPIRDIDGGERQLINWVAEIRTTQHLKNDWNRSGKLEDFAHYFEKWNFDWLDFPKLLRNTKMILEYPMVDRDPLPQWSFGRITLLGDAAHPMYPRGSNGAAQAIIDGRVIAECLTAEPNPTSALRMYEERRRPPTSKIVTTNRTNPPDTLIEVVDQRSGHRPFNRVEDVISVEEMKTMLDAYKRVAGYDELSLPARE